MKKSRLLIALTAIWVPLLYSCNGSDNGDEKNPILAIVGDPNIEAAATGSEATVNVASNIKWSAEPQESWIRVTSTDGDKFTVAIDASTEDQRKGTVKVSGKNAKPQIVTITQQGTFEVSTLELTFPQSTREEPQEIFVTDILDSWNVETDKSWISAFRSETGVNVYVSENPGAERSGFVILKPEGRKSVLVTVTQIGVPIPPEQFEGRYRVTGTLLRESDFIDSPTEWECNFVVDSDEKSIIVDHWAGYDAEFKIRYSVEEDPLARFYLIMPYADISLFVDGDGIGIINYFQPLMILEDQYWTHPVTGTTVLTNLIDPVRVASDPEDVLHESTMPLMELVYKSSDGTFKYYPPTVESESDGLHRQVGLGWRSASLNYSLGLLGVRAGVYTDVTFTRIGDLQ